MVHNSHGSLGWGQDGWERRQTSKKKIVHKLTECLNVNNKIYVAPFWSHSMLSLFITLFNNTLPGLAQFFAVLFQWNLSVR